MKTKHLLLTLLALAFLYSIGAALAKRHSPSIAASLPTPPVSGSGLLPVRIGNAAPSRMQAVIKGGTEKYALKISPCPTCRTYTGTPPQQCPSDTVNQDFALKPGVYEVQISFEGSPHIYTSQLTVAENLNKRFCFFQTYSPNDRPLQ